jgi:hypothetical protein
MNQCTETKRGNLSFFLGGKTWSDLDQWQPDMKAVHAAIRFAQQEDWKRNPNPNLSQHLEK